jgi:hypothetical protein
LALLHNPKGTDVKFAYRPKVVKKRDISSSDESEGEEESGDEDAKPAANTANAKPTKAKPKKVKDKEKTSQNRKDKEKTSQNSKARVVNATNDATDGDSWHCMKCARMNLATKKRCSDLSCQSWKGGIRKNIRSPKKRARS